MFRDLRVHLNQLGAPAAQIEINNAHADKFEVSWVQFFPKDSALCDFTASLRDFAWQVSTPINRASYGHELREAFCFREVFLRAFMD